MPFEFSSFEIEGPALIVPKSFADNRGFFFESFKKSAFASAGIATEFVQDNHSHSVGNGVMRGLHFQRGEHAQAKIVRCTRGKIFDVAVDVRPHSPTFGRHVAVELSEENKHMLFVPRGFAHGFMTLSEHTDVQYKADNEYAPQSESGILWNDPALAIAWPMQDAILSPKDTLWPTLSQAHQQGVLL